MPRGVLVNDVRSRLSATRVREVVTVASREALAQVVGSARRRGLRVCVAGGRHSVGGQAFAEDAVLVDTRGLDLVGPLDPAAGTVEVEAGTQWPALIAALGLVQEGADEPLTIAQRAGGDRRTVGGAVSVNAHGRGLAMRPIVDDVESLTIVDAGGELRVASRQSDPELFSLAVGGFGLFGIIVSASLRLRPRRKIERVVSVERVDDLIDAFSRRIEEGGLYGDFLLDIDESTPDF